MATEVALAPLVALQPLFMPFLITTVLGQVFGGSLMVELFLVAPLRWWRRHVGRERRRWVSGLFLLILALTNK